MDSVFEMPVDKRVGWTDEQVGQLKALRADGCSYGFIAEELKMTRNAVMGKAHRLGLLGVASTLPKSDVSARPKKRKAKILRLPTAAPQDQETEEKSANDLENFAATIPLDQRKTLMELQPHHCRWPVGDPGTPEFFFCGGDKQSGSSYCTFHSRFAFTSSNNNRTLAEDESIRRRMAKMRNARAA